MAIPTATAIPEMIPINHQTLSFWISSLVASVVSRKYA